MTLKQAYEEWGKVEDHAILATKVRTAITRVYLKDYGTCDLRTFNGTFVRECLSKCRESQQDMVKTTSVLTQILTWFAGRGECAKPKFDYTIASTVRKENPKKEATPQEPKMEPAPTSPVPANRRPNGPREVVEINPDTLDVINRYQSVGQAVLQTGFSNIDKHCRTHKARCGHWFAYADELDGWKPTPTRLVKSHKTGTVKSRKPKAARKAKVAGQPEVVTATVIEESISPTPNLPVHVPATRQDNPLSAFTDEQLADELMNRGYDGDLTLVKRLSLKSMRG